MTLRDIKTVNNNELSVDVNTYQVLKETLYPGAKDESIKMVLNYCKARKLDPLLKPVHLVPISVKSGKKDSSGKDIYERRDVVMPGIGLYRIDASRSGLYAGMSEPEFGEEITKEFGDKVKKKVTFPKWAKITVKKILPDGSIAEFTAKEFWLENYASKSKFDDTPNDMWEKRAYGQLAKCAEAQALRKAFPDIVGQEPTKEEMEGKFHVDNYQPKPAKQDQKIIEGEKIDSLELDYKDFLQAIEKSETEEQLRAVFTEIKKIDFKTRPDLFKNLIDSKDKRKEEITIRDFNKEIDSETGEVLL